MYNNFWLTPPPFSLLRYVCVCVVVNPRWHRDRSDGEERGPGGGGRPGQRTHHETRFKDTSRSVWRSAVSPQDVQSRATQVKYRDLLIYLSKETTELGSFPTTHEPTTETQTEQPAAHIWNLMGYIPPKKTIMVPRRHEICMSDEEEMLFSACGEFSHRAERRDE